MSFKFNFDLEDSDNDEDPQLDSTSGTKNGAGPSSPRQNVSDVNGVDEKSVWDEKSYDVSLDELLDTLPSRILYSLLPLPFSLPHPLLRRDLHDARFQLASTSNINNTQLSEDNKEVVNDDQGEAYVSAGAGTDLIPGLYEGGLKTWEGGVDLVEVLSGVKGGIGEWSRGSGVLEVGCGTALPSSYILSRLLALPPSSESTDPPTRILCQDYNLPVLTLVSLPNLLLASLPYLPLTSLEPIPTDPSGTHQALEEVDDIPDFSTPGELEITPELKEGFKALLKERRIELGFRYGGWGGLSNELEKKKGTEKGWGLVISAETIYSEGSVGDLIEVLRAATAGTKDQVEERDRRSGEVGAGGGDVILGMDGLSVKDEDWSKVDLRDGGSVILIAAKVLYFGVGGGIQNFLARVEGEKGWWTTVKEWTQGVGRKVVRVGW